MPTQYITLNELRKYETFDSISKMDDYISDVLSECNLKEIDRSMLRLLASHSCKFIGVSFLKVQTIADKLKVSYKTTQRSLARLVKLGVIVRHKTIKPKSGGKGACLTQISGSRPIELTYCKANEKPRESKLEKPLSENETVFSQTKSSKDIINVEGNSIDYSYLRAFKDIPESFLATVKPFVSPELAFSLWNKANKLAKQFNLNLDFMESMIIGAFKASVVAQKSKIIRGDFTGYFYGILKKLFAKEAYRVFTKPLVSYNWL